MPRRWSTQTRYWAYRFLCLRDGEFCANCGDPPTTPYTLDIDHIDADPHNNAESNLRLLCRACNVARENRRRRRPSVQGERENPHTRVCKVAVPYREGSPEMQANYLYEVDYRAWVTRYIDDIGWISKKEAINAGAEVVGCNPTTAAKYLAKLTSMTGPLRETRDMLGDLLIVKNGHKPPQGGTTHENDEIPRDRSQQRRR